MTPPSLPWSNLGQLVHEHALRYGSRPLFRFEGKETSFAQAEERTNRLAQVLKAQGIGRGDRVAVMLPNGAEFPLIWLAIAKVGAVMVPLNTGYQEKDLQYVLNDSGARLALIDQRYLPLLKQVQPLCPELRAIGVLGQHDFSASDVLNIIRAMEQAPATPVFEQVSGDDLVNIQYTSGTTGFPKGCMLTHDYWLLLGQLAAEYYGATESDVNMTAQPFYYMDPQWNTVLCLIAGIPLVILPRFSATTFWQSVKDNGVTIFYLLGTMPVFLLKQPENPALERGHKLRIVLCSGIVPQLHATYEARWGVPWREAFGMTESGADLWVPIDDASSVGSGAVGRPVRTKEAQIVDAAGKTLPDGGVGELVMRGKPMMRGYWNKPEATAQVMRDGWLHTGDLAYRDAQGYYHLVGRLKDMIRRGGENIAASEVEAALAEHPAVRAAAVVAVPDDLRGEEVKAYIQLQPGETRETTSPEALIAFVKSKLAAFKAPRYIAYVEAFPMTPSERIAKHRLTEQQLPTYDATTHTWQ